MKYRKKPVEVEAVLWTGENFNELWEFAEGHIEMIKTFSGNTYMVVRTLEGKLAADIGDYIIKGVKGEFYPCKPDIFELTYEQVK